MNAALGEWLIDPADLPERAARGMPLAFVELDRLPQAAAPGSPPFPLIGIGPPAHPSARWVDAVVEPPVTAAGLIRQIQAQPHAAAVAVALLRSIEGLADARGLPIESLAYGVLQGSAAHAAWLDSRPAGEPRAPGRVRLTRSGDTLRIVLDRPAARNAIDCALRTGLYEAFELAALDDSIARVELRAAGPAFSIGGDLDEFGTTRDPAEAHAIRMRSLPALPLSRRAAIVHAYVQGACIGSGLEIAAFAGRVTAAPSAWFQLPELAMGLIPGAGGCVSVPRRIGRQRAALMILSGKRIDAATALRWGLIDAVEDLPPIDPDRADAY